jgi:hypothetical protein
MGDTVIREVRVTNAEECVFRGCDDMEARCLLPDGCLCEELAEVPCRVNGRGVRFVVIFPPLCPFGGKPFTVQVVQ